MADNVKFVHYCGTNTNWNINKDSSKWDNSIVFGKILENNTWQYKIFAGNVFVSHLNTSVNYEYNIIDASKFEALIDDSSNEQGQYTNQNSVHYWIQQAISDSELSAEKFMALVDSSNSNVSIGIVDSSLVFEVEDAATTNAVTTAKSVGYVTSGMTIPKGTTLQELVDMIFTKVLGLSGSTAPSASLSGIISETKEVGEEISSISLTATYNDGHWDNEESWKNSYSGNQPYQMYGTTAQTYAFSGMTTVEAQSENTTTITNYIVNKGSQRVKVTITNTNSVNVPVNQKGESLTSGSANNTSTYKPYVAADVSAYSGTITGDYRYWIGYSTKSANELTRSDVLESASGKQAFGWAGNGVNYSTQFNSPYHTYVTLVVPNGMTLKTAKDSFGNDVSNNFVKTNITGLGIRPNDEFTVYQEWAEADAGLERKNIILN